jgi:hypothetical protein
MAAMLTQLPLPMLPGSATEIAPLALCKVPQHDIRQILLMLLP